MYKAYQGPAGALTELVGYLGGTTRVTALHQTLVQDSLDTRVLAESDVRYTQIQPGNYSEANILYTPHATSETTAAARFACNIPQGATILSATFDLYNTQSSNEWTTPTDDWALGVEQVDDAAAITSRQNLLDRYENVGTTVTWAKSTNSGTGNPVPSAPDIAALVQAVVDRPGWESGNHIACWVHHPSGGTMGFQLWGWHTSDAGLRPRLRIGYEYPA